LRRAPKHRAVLTTCYAAGLRISEAVHLRPRRCRQSADGARIEQGKGQAAITRRASNAGRAPAEVIQELIVTALADEARFLAAVEQGFAELDAGQLVTHEEVGQRIERRFRWMPAVRWAPKAVGDLERIFRYLEQSNPAAARRVVDSVYEAASSLLQTFPERGRVSRRHGARELV
jgi:predicted transcriptional regulator